MKKSMCIVYEVDGALYLNLTNKCSNNCLFCIRNNGDGAYGSDSLWLEYEPTVERVLSELSLFDIEKYREIVFCGYGEPSFRLYDAREIALKIKKDHPSVKIRINTNGQSSLILNTDSAPLYEGAFDAVSISLNAADPIKYDKICRPRYKGEAFYAILDFAERVKLFVPEVVFSVVKETLSDEELALCHEISERISVPLRVRDYISAGGDEALPWES